MKVALIFSDEFALHLLIFLLTRKKNPAIYQVVAYWSLTKRGQKGILYKNKGLEN
jgi:hypothetical protein